MPPFASASTWISTCRAGCKHFSTYSDPLPNDASASAAAARKAPSSSSAAPTSRAPSAAPGHSLHEQREADLTGDVPGLLERRRPVRAGQHRHACRPELGFARVLSPIRSITSALRPAGTQLVLLAGRDEGRVLRQEPPPRVHGVTACRLGRRDDRRDAQVTVDRGRRPMQTARSASRVCSESASAVE